MSLLILAGLFVAAILNLTWIFWILVIGWGLARIFAIFGDLSDVVTGSFSKKVGAFVDLLWQGALVAFAVYIYSLG